MTTVTAQKTPKPDSAIEAARPYLRRLERMVTTLLSMKFESADGLLKLQTDLLSLQRSVQQAITATKATAKTKSRAETLDALRMVLWECRRFGDAYAWVLLDNDRQVIYPLAENPQQVSVPPFDEAWRGFEVVVQHIGANGCGFPLLHDITDTLRIGDVTFIKPGEPPATAEVKTQVLRSEPTDDGRTVSYRVTAVWAGEDPPARVKAATKQPGKVSANAEPPPVPRPVGRKRTIKPEFGRQLKRMRKAEMLQTAKDGQVIEHDDGASFTIVAPHYEGRSHWPALRRLVREARRNGYATATVEDAIMYVAIHNKDGITSEADLEVMSRTPSDLIASGILWSDPAMRDRNRLAIFQIPEGWKHVNGPQRYLPYFLYPLQRWAVLDLLHDRLAIMAMLNVGRLAAALEAKGLEVEMPDTDREYHRSPLTAFTTVEAPDGSRYRAGVTGLHLHLMEMIMEAKPLDYFAEIAVAMAEAARANLPRSVAG